MNIDAIQIKIKGRDVKTLIHTYSDVDMSKCDFATGEKVLVVHEEVYEKLVKQNGLMANRIKKLQEENKILREALEFYSVEDDWNFYCGCCANGSTKLEKDHGKLARETLAKVNNENN